MRIGCVGMATLDMLLFVPEQELSHDVVASVTEAVQCPGGKGMVTAAAIEEAGGEVVPFALLGEDSILAGALPPGLERRYQLPLLSYDNRTWITISHAQKVVTFVFRGELDAAHTGTITEAIELLVGEVDGLYLTVEEPRVLRAALGLARAKRIPIALNASIPLLELLLSRDRQLLLDLAIGSDLVFCNQSEDSRFLELLGLSGWGDLVGAGQREVVVTEGEDGGRFASGSEKWSRFEPARPESVRCVVGAGDTFNGAYLVARWAESASAAESCRQGAELAARKVAVRRSMLPSPQRASAS